MIEVIDNDGRTISYPTGTTWDREDGYLRIYDEGRHLIGEHSLHEWQRVRLVTDDRPGLTGSGLPGFPSTSIADDPPN